MRPTEHLLDDIAAAGGPTVTLEARLDDCGGVVRLSVRVYDATQSQVLYLPFPRDHDRVSYDELIQASAFWTLLVEAGVYNLELPDDDS